MNDGEIENRFERIEVAITVRQRVLFADVSVEWLVEPARTDVGDGESAFAPFGCYRETTFSGESRGVVRLRACGATAGQIFRVNCGRKIWRGRRDSNPRPPGTLGDLDIWMVTRDEVRGQATP